MSNPILLNVTTTPLAPHLLDLLSALEQENLTLTLVGGFGLILRQEYLKVTGQRTLLERIPPARATEDFDVMLHLELMADPEKLQALRTALDTLDYQVVERREHFQFSKELVGSRSVKVDLLTPQPEHQDVRFKISGERVSPKNLSQQTKGIPPVKLPDIHARRTPEAFAVADSPSQVELEGQNSIGQPVRSQVNIPHPYAYLLLKLFAFRDWETVKKQLPGARKHAKDIYTIVASLTPDEDDTLPAFAQQYANHPIALEATRIVQSLFGEETAIGVVRFQEGWEKIESEEMQSFLESLRRAFPS